LSWIAAQGIGTALIEPGKPWQNAVGENFNGKFRDECLCLEWFRSRKAVRPHSSLGYLTPNEFAARQTTNPAPCEHRAGALRYLGPQRPGPLHHPPT
jgi:putative transposase